MAPKISVIVPIYNVEPYVKECMESVVNQTLSDIEIICVDDCGTDNSMDIVRGFARADSRITIIHNRKNSGLSASRNNGIKRCHGKYIMFCDSDDYFAPDMCEKMYNAISISDTDMAICGTNIIYEANHNLHNADDAYFKVHDTGIQNWTPQMRSKYSVCVWNKIYRRDIIVNHNVFFPVGLKYEDNFYFNAYSAWVQRVAFVPEKLYNYRRRAGSIMNSTYQTQRLNLDPIKIAIAYFNYVHENSVCADKNYFWGTLFYNMFCAAISYCDKKNYKTCYQFAKTFIDKNYDSQDCDFYTCRKISLIRQERLHTRKMLCGAIKIYGQYDKFDIRFLGISVWKIKYKPNKSKYFLLGVQIWTKYPYANFFTHHKLKTVVIDNSQILNELKKLKHFTFIPNAGNAGDMLIASATYAFFDANHLTYKQYKSIDSTELDVVYGGGGIWTPDYEQDWEQLLPIFKHAKKVVILPSSFKDCQKLIDVLDERFVVFCRERDSYEYLIATKTSAKILLDHDMAFRMQYFPNMRHTMPEYIEKVFYKNPFNNIPSTAYFMRQDIESKGQYKSDMDVSALAFGDNFITQEYADLCAGLMLGLIDRADNVITDRLHVAISAMLLNKQVYMLDNSYGKLSAVYKHSMQGCTNVHFCDEVPKFE